jgi:LacI family transcriptional regulator
VGVRRRSTLRDVARRAGVSVGTASGVFTSNASVSERARNAVLAAAADLGYQPRRRSTQRLPAGVTTFGLLARAEHYVGPQNPFYGPVLYGAQQAATGLGLSLVLETVPDESDPGEMPLIVRRKQAQGVLLAGYFHPEFLTAMARTDIASVVIDHDPGDIPIDCVCADDHRGGYLATTHLLELGHRDPPPAIIGGPPTSTSTRARLEGYLAALQDAGIPVDPSYIREGRLTAESGREQMRVLLSHSRPPTAVFCCNDNTALGVIDMLRDKGVDVPGEVSVIGYDDIAMAAHSMPRLTTIAVDKELLGMQAVWALAQRISHPQIGIRTTRLRVGLVERASTAPRRSDRDPPNERRHGG